MQNNAAASSPVNPENWKRKLRSVFGHLVVASVLFGAFTLTAAFLSQVGAEGYEQLFQMLIWERLPAGQVVLTLLLFVLFAVTNDLIDLKADRKTRPPTVLFFPLMLTAVMGNKSLFIATLCFVITMFALRKIEDNKPLLPSVETSEPIRWYKPTIIAMVLIPLLPAAFVGNLLVVLIWMLLYALSYWFFERNRQLFFRAEQKLLLVVLPALVLLTLFDASGNFPNQMVFTTLLVIFSFLHMYLFARNKHHMRRYNTAMLVMLVFVFAGVEMSLAPLNLGGRKQVGQEASEIDREASPEYRGKVLGKILPAGMFNDLPQGWYIEVDHFRGKDPSEEREPGTIRILCQGSSATEGHGVKNTEDVWPAVLERMLNEMGYPYVFEVFNAGIGGTTSFQMLVNFRSTLLKYQPDMLILYISHNDQTYSFGPFTEREMYEMVMVDEFSAAESETKKKAPPRHLENNRTEIAILKTQRFLTHFSLYRLLRKQVLDVRQVSKEKGTSAITQVSAVPPWDFAANLSEFDALCRENGIKLVLVGEGSRIDLTRYKSIMASVAAARDIPYFDTNARLYQCGQDLSEIFSDVVHLTVPGNECIARLIRDFLIERKMLPESL